MCNNELLFSYELWERNECVCVSVFCFNYFSCVTDFLLSGSKQEDGGSPLSPLSYPMLPSYPALQTQVIMVVCKLSPLRGFVCGVCLRVCVRVSVCVLVSERVKRTAAWIGECVINIT